MDTYGKRLDAALKAKNDQNKDRKWLAGKIGISEQALSQVILGVTKALKAANHEMAVEALDCSGMWLATGAGDRQPTKVVWPFQLIGPDQYRQLDEDFKRHMENGMAGEWMRVQVKNGTNN